MLTRAILDTFPLIKFGAPRNKADTQMGSKDQDLEAYGNHSSPMLETRDIQSDVVPSTSTTRLDTPRASTTDPGAAEDDNARLHDDEPEISDADLPPARPRAGPSRSATTTMATISAADPLPESIGREMCPICIVDFEDGDDLRVLPCEGKHVFHQACVDPWLLELSSSCPICRHGMSIPQHLCSSLLIMYCGVRFPSARDDACGRGADRTSCITDATLLAIPPLCPPPSSAQDGEQDPIDPRMSSLARGPGPGHEH